MLFFSKDHQGGPTSKNLTLYTMEGLRQILGAFRTSPVDSLYSDAHEVPLQLRCKKLALQYYTKLKSCPFNPTCDCLFNPKYEQHCKKGKINKTFWLSYEVYSQRIQSSPSSSSCRATNTDIPDPLSLPIFLNYIHTTILPQTPPGIIKNRKWFSNWMNSLKQKPIPVLIRRNFTISFNIIPTTYTSLWMAPRTITKRLAQLF